MTLPFHQIEGISTTDGLDYTLSNERFSQIVMVPPRLHRVNLSDYLMNYLDGLTEVEVSPDGETDFYIRTQDSFIEIIAGDSWIGQQVSLVDLWGRVIVEEMLRSNTQVIPVLKQIPRCSFSSQGKQ